MIFSIAARSFIPVKARGGPIQFRAGRAVFGNNCSGCHPYGGNIVDAAFRVMGALQLKDAPAFLQRIRDPRLRNGSRGIMPPFPASRISDQQTETVRDYIVKVVEGRIVEGRDDEVCDLIAFLNTR